MGFWLAGAADAARAQAHGGWLKRFDPRYWTVDNPRPMVACVTTTAADALRVDAVFYRSDDLAGLIWAAEDRLDHPLLRYETARDFRGCTLRFRWRSRGVRPLDAVNGPTLTIEGRDAAGAARSWYVRLWNYASGTPEDARVAIDFADLDGGFLLPGEADPVWAGDVDRLFVSLVPPGYTGAAGVLAGPAEAQVELTEIACDGPGSVLAVGEALVPPHGGAIATGFDDAYNQTPARLLGQALALGYRGPIDHYVGMSHYFRLGWQAAAGRFLVGQAGGALNVACAAWHRDFLARAAALGFAPILSLSYELFDRHCPDDWKQRGPDGTPALTGWEPPSTLLSPASAPAMAYLKAVAQAFATLAAAHGRVRFQVGEPWWWVRADGTICLHDAAARAAIGSDGVTTVLGPQPAAVQAALDRAGAVLAASTAALVAAVRAVAPDAEALLLAFLPTVLDPRMPDARRANLPVGWAAPAFDRLQLEDYDWVTTGDTAASARGAATATARLGYPVAAQDYLTGFVLRPGDAAAGWPRIEAAGAAARARGVPRVFVWALPQVARDGFTRFAIGEGTMQAFDEVDFPLDVGREASVAPAFSTAIVTTAAGVEQRNADWADARLRFDAGPGVRSEADIATLLAFFRARRGAARAFRFRDPFDSSSGTGDAAPTPVDQRLGTGDGATARFALVKRYGDGDDAQVRAIARPVAGSVRVSVDGVERRTGWAMDGGTVAFEVAPAAGAVVRAGFRFDVAVRFEEDRLAVSRAAFRAGDAPSVPLIEVRER